MRNEIDVPIGRLMAEQVTLNVRIKGVSMAKFRIRLAVPLLKLAAKVAGVGISVEADYTAPGPYATAVK